MVYAPTDVLTDSEVAAAIRREEIRQRDGIELIASENFVSRNVMAAVGSVLTNKYAEGYAGKRYYGGCEFIDEVETLAIERAKLLFGAEHVNVQPHSGANANLGAYLAIADPGSKILGLSLSEGGPSDARASGQFLRSTLRGAFLHAGAGNRSDRLRQRRKGARRRSARRLSSPAPVRTVAISTMRASGRLPTRSAHSWSRTSRTRPAL